MKHYTIIKKGTSTPPLNHIYEHLYCIEVGRSLKKRGFVNYVDYRIDARNYHAGFIYITALFYNEDIFNQVDLAKIAPSFSHDDIELAITQLGAESDVRVHYDEKQLDAALRELHAEPWENLDSTQIYNWRHTRRHARSWLFADPIAPSNFRNIECHVMLDQDYASAHEDVLPVFHELAQAILFNLSDILTDTYGYFGLESDSIYDLKTTAEFHTFRIHKKKTLSVDDLVDVTKGYATRQLDDTFKMKFNNYLVAIADPRNYYFNELDVFEVTGVVVGTERWKDLAADHVIEDMLRHCSISCKDARTTVTFRLVDA